MIRYSGIGSGLGCRQAWTKLRLFSALEDYDDTQNVFANFDIADEIVEQIEL